ncbi:MAG: acyl-CoA dehydrogenase family protein [Myxococcota bacterium]|nr:acyl-CoA dehydrogenase family protein [Myxococcota bacterium]
MDLSYGAEYEQYRGEVAAFLKANWPLEGDEAGLSHAEQALVFRKRAIEAGFLARSIPKAYGGSEQPADALRGQIIREEFGKAHAPGDARGIGTMMLVPTLLDRGEEWQKQKWVGPTVLGETTWCQGYSEPGSGSDLASLKTRGELVGDGWVINGQKIWTSGAHRADYMFCLVRTEPEAQKHAGISYLLIDMKQPGIDVRPLKMMTGTSEFNEVFLNDVKTPKDWIVGKRGEGWLVSRTTLKHERNSIGDASATEALFKGLLDLARRSKRGGQPAIEDPAVRQRLGEIEGYMLSHKYSGYRQLSAQLKGENPGLIATMNKLNSTNIAHRIAKLALDLLGDDGMLDPQGQGALMGMAPKGAPGWLSQYMSSLGVAIAGGTANIQRNVIGERGLGLPRDMAVQRSK